MHAQLGEVAEAERLFTETRFRDGVRRRFLSRTPPRWAA